MSLTDNLDEKCWSLRDFLAVAAAALPPEQRDDVHRQILTSP